LAVGERSGSGRAPLVSRPTSSGYLQAASASVSTSGEWRASMQKVPLLHRQCSSSSAKHPLPASDVQQNQNATGESHGEPEDVDERVAGTLSQRTLRIVFLHGEGQRRRRPGSGAIRNRLPKGCSFAVDFRRDRAERWHGAVPRGTRSCVSLHYLNDYTVYSRRSLDPSFIA